MLAVEGSVRLTTPGTGHRKTRVVRVKARVELRQQDKNHNP